MRFKVTNLILALLSRGPAMIFAMTFVVLLIFLASGLAIMVSPVFFFVLVVLMAIACVLTVVSNMVSHDGPAVVPSDAFLRDDAGARSFRAGQGQKRNR